MTFVSKNTKVFLEAKDKVEVTSVRSEARLKTYPSAIDIRAWCDIVEDRRKHILEYQSKGRTGLCPGSLVPVEKLIEILMASKNNEMKEIQKKIEYYEELIKIYDSLLTPEQKAKLEELKKALDAKYGDGGEGDDVCKAPCATGTQTDTPGQGAGGEICDDKCSCDDLAAQSACALNNCTGPCADETKKPDCPADDIPGECKCADNKNSGGTYVCRGPCSMD